MSLENLQGIFSTRSVEKVTGNLEKVKVLRALKVLKIYREYSALEVWKKSLEIWKKSRF